MGECENKKYHDELKVRVRQLEASNEKLKKQNEVMRAVMESFQVASKLKGLENECVKILSENVENAINKCKEIEGEK